jgi:hypothetical protein
MRYDFRQIDYYCYCCLSTPCQAISTYMCTVVSTVDVSCTVVFNNSNNNNNNNTETISSQTKV